jgi:hypothetical protein
MQTRAKRGGETGKNGEQYAGGTFLPTTTLGKMAKRTICKGPRRVQIERFVWVDAREGFRPIFDQFPYAPEAHPQMRERVNPAYVDVPRLDTLYALWAQGERWFGG